MSANHEKFALENPISVITGKDKEQLTREDLLHVISEKQLEKITFRYTAIDGKIKELKIPVTSRKQAELVLSEGERVDGSSLFRGMVDTGQSDMYVVPSYRTAFLNPFDDKSLDLVCRFMNKEGELASFAPDNILSAAHGNLIKHTGLELHALGEMEFYLIGNHNNPTYPLPKQKGYHATAPFVKTGDIINEILKNLAQITGNIKYAHNEVGSINMIDSDYAELNGKAAEQVEVEFLPTKLEDTGDIMVLASWIIRNIAYKHGFIATFFPKIDIDHAGNGLHFHTALMKNGKNIMTIPNGDLSPEAMQLIGGLCNYAPSLTSFGNMVSSSYLRLVPNQEAPTKVCWSECNRSALIRVPLAWTKAKNLAMKINPQQPVPMPYEENRQTVELRSPDGSANVHLLLAGIAMAADWGLANKEQATQLAKNSYVSYNIHTNPYLQDLAELATSCVESSEMLLQHRSNFERDGIFPSNVIDFVSKILQNENDRNLNSRLLSLPEEDKQIESRRIMHRNIHKH